MSQPERTDAQRLSAALAAAQVGTWELDLRTRLYRWDPTAEALFGYAPGTFPTKAEDVFASIFREDQARLLLEREQALRERIAFRAEYRVRAGDGTVRWLSSSASPEFDEEGAPSRLVGVIMDISESKQRETTLQNTLARLSAQQTKLDEQMELLRTVADALPAAVVYVDKDERVVLSNRYYREVYLRRSAAQVGLDLRAVVGEEQYLRLLPLIRRALAGETVRLETEVHRAGMSSLWVSATYLPDIGPDGGVRGFIALSEDITERRRRDDALKDAVRARDEFVSVASHELKTPLTGMKLRLQMRAQALERGGPVPEAAALEKGLRQDLKQVDRISRLIEDMLDIARINTGRLSLSHERCDLGELLRDVNDRLKDALAAAGCAIRYQEPSAPIVGQWDRFRLEQVYVNLLTNAARYAPNTPVHVLATATATHARLSVRDEGPGVAVADQERIFNRFERAAGNPNITGLGLGLYISRDIVHSHGGTLTVRSDKGAGAEFVVELPLERGD